MSLFSSALMDPGDMFFGPSSIMRQMRQMNNMMNSMFADPFGMMPDMGPLSIMAPRNRMMPFMPDININDMMTGNNMMAAHCNSFTSSTIVMSSGPDGRPQVYSETRSTNMGPGGVKETRRTVEDTVTGTKKMSIGHHIHDRAHLIEREQNFRSGDLEERQEFINLDEEEADDFNREFESAIGRREARARIMPARQPLLALPPAPSTATSSRSSSSHSHRRPLRPSNNPALPSTSSSNSGVRNTYRSSHPQRSKQRASKNYYNANDY